VGRDKILIIIIVQWHTLNRKAFAHHQMFGQIYFIRNKKNQELYTEILKASDLIDTHV